MTNAAKVVVVRDNDTGHYYQGGSDGIFHTDLGKAKFYKSAAHAKNAIAQFMGDEAQSQLESKAEQEAWYRYSAWKPHINALQRRKDQPNIVIVTGVVVLRDCEEINYLEDLEKRKGQ